MLIDQHGRTVNYLRISLTERCNFRCMYCMPDKPLSWVPKENILSFEELFAFVKVAVDRGIEKIRITGGEPTLRNGIENFVAMIASYAPQVDLALTTNGYLMDELAEPLRKAGLKRVNISLDSLKREVAGKIANRDVLEKVLAGIEASIAAGLRVKINMVPMKRFNEDEVLAVLEYCKARNIPIRFIEYMENNFAHKHVQGLTSTEILKKVGEKYRFEKTAITDPNSPAVYYRLEDGYEFGIIEPHHDNFCESCNRLRLTAEGFLIPCLYFDEAMSIKEFVQKGDIAGAVKVLETILANKPEKNRWSVEEGETSNRAFYQTGG